MMVFGQEWFREHQRLLLWIANAPIIGRLFRRLICLGPSGTTAYRGKMVGLAPDSVHYHLGGREFRAEFYTGPKMSNHLHKRLYPLWWLFHQWDRWVAAPLIPTWDLGFATLQVYTAASASTNLDGYVANYAATWSSARGGTGTFDKSTNVEVMAAGAYYENGLPGTEYWCGRNFMHFDTSALQNTAITAATLDLYTAFKLDTGSRNTTDLYASTVTDATTALANSDYANFGSTSFGTKTLANWTIDATASLTLNSSGLSGINKTGKTKLCLRLEDDVNNVSPVDASQEHYVEQRCADYSGGVNAPRLTITYTPVGEFFSSMG